jgi:predicted TIM-barrel fold metal-dependent hydrolase
MPSLPYPVYDADNHLYEPAEAFLRHLPARYENEFYFAEVKGRTKLVINGELSEYIPNPTFEVVAAPGVHEKWYRAANAEGLSMRELSGKPIRPPEDWRVGEGRLRSLEQQGIHSALVFPTLASVIEARFEDKPEVISALFRSFNTWLEEEWGFARENRLFAVPMIGLGEIDEAVDQLEAVLKAGSRCVGIRPGPVPGLRGGRSPGLAEFDPFWSRCAEANIFVCLHASDSGYAQIYQWWSAGNRSEYLPFQRDPFTEMLEPLARPITDTISALICHGVFDRNPNLRVISVENSSYWVGSLLKQFDRAYGQMPKAFRRHPRETFREHIFVAPAYEDDMDELAVHMSADRILFGSDYPHPEGLSEPLNYLKEFENFSDSAVERIFHSNLKGLLEGARD